MDKVKKKAKRGSVSFAQFIGVDDGDEAKANLKYRTLLDEHLELQKELVSRKKKLQAAKQKKETILAEVRFLRRRHDFLSKSQVPLSDIQSDALQGEANHSTFEAAPEMISNSIVKDEEAVRNVHNDGVRFNKKLKNRLILDKGVGKRKISWLDQVSLSSNSVTLHS